MAQFIEVSKTDEWKETGMKVFTVNNQEILLCRSEGRYFAFQRYCPHMRGDLSQGRLKGTVITCPLHGSQFHISSGEVVRWLRGGLVSKISKVFKSSRTLRIYPVKVEDDKILVDISS
jgi:nitrite reductase/ring-hydroxylating ferredoxin subunit